MGNTTSAERVERIRRLSHELLDQTILNTAKSRARCRELASEIVTLLDAEDADQPPPLPPVLEQALMSPAPLSTDVGECVDAGEHAELTRLYVLSDRAPSETLNGQQD